MGGCHGAQMIKWFSKRCKHEGETYGKTIAHELRPGDFSVIEQKTLGVTLGWSGKPEVLRQSKLHCNLCGQDYWASPGYMPYKELEKTPRNNSGWPLNADGSRMKIAS